MPERDKYRSVRGLVVHQEARYNMKSRPRNVQLVARIKTLVRKIIRGTLRTKA